MNLIWGIVIITYQKSEGMMGEQKTYWFQNSATVIRVGKPIAWQGWAVIISYIILVLFPLTIRHVLGNNANLIQVANQAIWTVILFIIAIRKGKPGIKKEKSAEDQDDYWFPKNDTGLEIGYGFPVTWQGWLLLIAHVFVTGIPLIIKSLLGKFFILVFLLNGLFWTICLLVMVVKHGEK